MPNSQEKRPFLDSDGDDEKAASRAEQYYLEQPKRSRTILALAAANMVLLAACVVLSFSVLFLASSSGSDKGNVELSDPYSPANHAIEYEYRGVIRNDTRFMGFPGPEWEQSMHDLMAGTLIRISDEELRLAGSDSIPLKDGGYAAGLGVGHNLHCVKQIKRFLYREHFYPEVKPDTEDYDYVRDHADHCLDFIRQGILCHLDYSLYTVYWGERRQDIPTHRDPPVQKCVNWDKLHAWMRGRVASTDMLVGPLKDSDGEGSVSFVR